MRYIMSLPVLFSLFLAGTVHARPWVIPRDFASIQDAVDSNWVKDGDRLIVQPGRHRGAVLTKSLGIVGRPGAVIDSGPVFVAGNSCIGDMMAGFLVGMNGDGAGAGSVIRNLVFDRLAFPVYANEVDGITVSGNIILGAVQGITNRGGRNWRIGHNLFQHLRTANGGGIAIFITDSNAREGGVAHNQVNYNTIFGTLTVCGSDGGGYSGGGIFINADFRNGSAGAESIHENLVSYNRIALLSSDPMTVDAVGIVLEDSRNLESVEPIVFNNVIMYNDLHTLETPFVFAPASLEAQNWIFMNGFWP